MNPRRIGAFAVIATASAACAGLLGIDDVDYSDDRAEASLPDAGADSSIGDAGDAACADGGCCVCPDDASCVGSCVTTIYTSSSAPAELARGGTFLYFVAGSSSVYRCATPSCSSAAEIAKPEPLSGQSLAHLATTDRFLVIGVVRSFSGTTQHALLTCDHGRGCGENPSPFPNGNGQLLGIAADDASVAWTATADGPPFGDGALSLFSCRSTGCDAGATSTKITDGGGPSDVSGGALAILTPNAFVTLGDEIKTARLDGEPSARLVTTSTAPRSFFVWRGYLYFVRGKGNASVLERCPADGGACPTPELVADATTGPIAGDSTSLYWLLDDPGGVQVYRWRFDDPLRTAKRIAIAEGSGSGLAVDDAHLYWSARTDGGGGGIYRLAK